jgi:hypothetical protein
MLSRLDVNRFRADKTVMSVVPATWWWVKVRLNGCTLGSAGPGRVL